MKPTVDIIGELFAGFNPFTTINNVVDNLDGSYTITVCNTLNIRKASPFKINVSDFVATIVDTTLKTITYVSGVAPTKGDRVYGTIPFYFPGTPAATGNEIQTILKMQTAAKLPMNYLMEIITDTFDRDHESSLGRTSNVRLFFLDEANFADWDTEQHYAEAIIPMMNYAEAFLDYLDQSGGIGVISSATLTYHAKFGLNIRTNTGHIQNLFPDMLSGVEMTVNLPILKKLSCEC